MPPAASGSLPWGASVNPRLVELHLPWEGYNPEFIFLLNQVIVEPDTHERQMLIRQLHPKSETLNDRTVRLHCRNIGIIEGTKFVIALPNWDKPEGGGTGMGIKVAEHFGIRIFDLSKEEDRQRILAKIEVPPTLNSLAISHRASVRQGGLPKWSYVGQVNSCTRAHHKYSSSCTGSG